MNPKCCFNKKSVADIDDLAEFLKIISEKNRLKILCMLKNNERCVCDIWKFLGLSQNLTSSHLKILRDAKLIKSRQDGQYVYYSINQDFFKKCNLLLINFIKKYE